VRRRLRRPQQRAHQHPQRLPVPGVRHPGRHSGRRDPQAPVRLVLPGLAAGAPPPSGAGADHRGGHLLPAGGIDPADGEARREPRDHPAQQVPGQRDGQGPRRPRRGLPAPPPGRRPVHVRGRRRPRAQGPRRRPGGQRPRARGDRGQRRRAPGDPRPAGHLRRGRRRLADLLPRPDRPRTDRSSAGHQRRARRAGRRHRRDPARRGLAALPHPLGLSRIKLLFPGSGVDDLLCASTTRSTVSSPPGSR
jgi:hypothetical protein